MKTLTLKTYCSVEVRIVGLVFLLTAALDGADGFGKEIKLPITLGSVHELTVQRHRALI